MNNLKFEISLSKRLLTSAALLISSYLLTNMARMAHEPCTFFFKPGINVFHRKRRGSIPKNAKTARMCGLRFFCGHYTIGGAKTPSLDLCPYIDLLSAYVSCQDLYVLYLAFLHIQVIPVYHDEVCKLGRFYAALRFLLETCISSPYRIAL